MKEKLKESKRKAKGKLNDVRVCGGLPVFEFCLFYCMFLMISVNVTVHWFDNGFVDVLWKCIWPLLADVECLFCFVYFKLLFNDCVVLEGPNGNIFCISYWFYTCFAKIDLRVCGRFPVFENKCFYNVFLMISNFLNFLSFVNVLLRDPGADRAGTGHWPVLSDAHGPPYNTPSKNPISRA